MNKIKADLIIRNTRILTINADMQIIDNAMLVVTDDKITAVGPESELAGKYISDKEINGAGKLLMPGLVNSHTHVAMTVFRGIADDITLEDWLNKYIFPVEKECVNADLVLKGTRLATLEMISTGTTTFNDMYYFSGEVARAAKEIGMRALVSEGLVNFPAPNSPTPEDCLNYTKELLESYKNDPLISVSVGTHAPYTCTPELIRLNEDFAVKHGLNHHVHVAESQWEIETMSERYGLSPVKWLESLGILSEHFVAAHGVWVDAEDMPILKKYNVGVAHNPECNMKLSSGAAPIPEMLEAGIKVGLGTDGPASNNNLDLFQEMHTMALFHKYVKNKPTVISAREAVRMATMGGAELLNMETKIGSIEAGKQADFILIDLRNTKAVPMYDPYSAIVYSLSGSSVSDAFIAGKHIYQNKKFKGIDVDTIVNDVVELAEDVKLKIHNRVK